MQIFCPVLSFRIPLYLTEVGERGGGGDRRGRGGYIIKVTQLELAIRSKWSHGKDALWKGE